jgi:hypothetical protein
MPNVERVDLAPASTAFGDGSPDGVPQLPWPFSAGRWPELSAAERPLALSADGPDGIDAPLPPWPVAAGDASPAVEPLFGRELERLQEPRPHRFGPLGLLWRMAHRTSDVGLGQERLDYALFEIDSARPLNQFRVRADVVTGYPWPDRAEYLWAKPGKGPAADTGVSYQDLRFLQEIGGDKFSVATELPIRLLDPEHDANTTGMGDMNLTTKTVLLDGRAWEITQIFRTYFPTGAPHKGLSTGHFSLEPGLLARLKCTRTTYLNSELKYWIPLGGDPVHSGQVLRYGLGYSHVLFETDTWALVQTGEFLGFWFLDGQKIVDVATKKTVDLDGEGAFQIYPGLRVLVDTGGDLRFLDFGIAATFSTGRNSLYDSMLRFDFRFAF